MVQVAEKEQMTHSPGIKMKEKQPGSKQQVQEQRTQAATTACSNNDDDVSVSDPPSSMTFALFVTWVLPVLLLALFSRKLVDTTVPTIVIEPKPTPSENERIVKVPTTKPTTTKKHDKNDDKVIIPAAVSSARGPAAYQEIVQTINQRRRYIEGFTNYKPSNIAAASRQPKNENPTTTGKSESTLTTSKSKSTTTDDSQPANKRGISSDPNRAKFIHQINSLKEEYKKYPHDIYLGIKLADAMRFYDLRFHEGGTYELEALELYNKIVTMAISLRNEAIQKGLSTTKDDIMSVNDEVTIDYTEKSYDALLCAIYSARGKLYFMANMFERAVQSYDECIKIAPDYLDARDSRGSALIVLGKYDEAGRDYLHVVQKDTRRMFIDAFTGLARILEAKEESVPGGWDAIVDLLEDTIIPQFENQQSSAVKFNALNRLHHVMFTYHDAKTKNYPEAFRHLSTSYKYKMSLLEPWKDGSELFKVQQTSSIFTKGFFSSGLGSETRAPIFVVGFVRSGSTLLERILDAHPMIVGTGENSVFNGRLDDIRNQIVKASVSGQANSIGILTKKLADEVVDEMRHRWEVIDKNTERESNESPKIPQRFVDKMLTNYYNIGFIQMLYPNALVLHVIREPMDTLFSAYKHEFPTGTLDYTSEFKGLSELYIAYRKIMEHWDAVLPGRITHILYEDMVNDMPGIAKAIINATGLPWDDSVLDFHNKKQAVNTLSSTQVRKGIYRTSLKSWERYEGELEPLVELVSDYVNYDISTSLPNYSPPAGEDTSS